ncbi:MAG: glycosyltransferase [Syntrophaceae bacterium]
MKVLIITNSYPDNIDSYRGIFIRKLGLELIRQGLDVVVLTPRVLRDSPRLENDGGIRVHRFWYPSGGKPLGQSGAIPIIPMMVYMLSGLCKAISAIRSEHPDVIHGNWIVPTGLIAALAGRLMGVPVVNSAHGMDVRISARFPVGLLFDLAVRLSSRVTVVSEAMKSRPGLRQADTIPCGVDELFFAVHPASEKNRIVSTRSLEPIYNLATLIRAVPLVLERIPDAKFTIIGDGSQDGLLKNLAADLGVTASIEFIGRLENTEIPGHMSRAKVYVSTSLADGTSISLLEAMAAGLIPVVSDIDANRPWITHGEDGFFFPAGDSQALAEQIVQAMRGHIAAAALENKQALMKQTIAWPHIAERYINHYRACLKPRKAD